MNGFVMSGSCEGVLIENLEVCMLQEIAISSATIGAFFNMDLPMVEGCSTTSLTPNGQMLFFEF